MDRATLKAKIEEAARAIPSGMTDGAGAFAGLFVTRPVLAIVVNLLIVVAGFAAFLGAEVRELPDVDQPVVTVTTVYEGASPATIDAEVTEYVENAVARVTGLSAVSSESRFGRSQVTAEFRPDVDINVAANDVRDAIARIRTELPAEIDEPRIVKADANADEVMRLALVSDTLPVTELTRLADKVVAEALASIDGVADVTLRGERNAVLFIDIDQAALASRGLDIALVARVVSEIAGESPAGRLESPTQELVVRADAGIRTAEGFAAVQLTETTRLGDVARVFFGPETGTGVSRTNGKVAIGLGILRQAGSSTIAISSAVRAEAERLRTLLPPEAELIVASDEAVFVQGAVDEVTKALLEATLIVVGIILLFLGSLRATFIPAITMPIALIGTVGGIWAAGFSINILTLLALVLATGMVVDDAIVVLENVMRRRAQGLGARAAALVGTREVFFAVISTTATLAAVFIPISFLPGRAGGLFREFGFVLAIAVAISALVTLTLVPMLAARILPPAAEPRPRRGVAGLLAQGAARLAARLLGGLYARILRGALAAPLVTLVVAVLFGAGSALLYPLIPAEVTPKEDRGLILVSVSAPQGVSLAYTDTQLRRIEAALEPFRAKGEVETVFSFAGFGGANNAFLVANLAPWDRRTTSQDRIAGELTRALAGIPGVRAFPIQANSLRIRGGGRGLQFAVVGEDFSALAEAAQALSRRLGEDPRFGQTRLSFELTQPQLTVTVDRERAFDLGIDITGLSRAIQSVLDGREAGRLYLPGETVPIRLVSTGTTIDDPTDLENVFLRTGTGEIVPMSSIATLTESAAPSRLVREGRFRAVPVTASLTPGFPVGAAYAEVQAIAREVLPPGMSIVPLAEAAELGRSGSGMMTTFAIALVVVFLVLAAQFESFLAAVIIMLTVPLGLGCALVAIWLTGGSLNVYSQIGLVLLVGVMAKNGILIVEFANQLRERGLSVHEAIEQASLIRLRPVVMTAISTVLGGLPLVLGEGPGAEARVALGWVVVGGLGFATFATLFVTPVCYLLLARFAKPRTHEEERIAHELAAAARPGVPAE